MRSLLLRYLMVLPMLNAKHMSGLQQAWMGLTLLGYLTLQSPLVLAGASEHESHHPAAAMPAAPNGSQDTAAEAIVPQDMPSAAPSDTGKQQGMGSMGGMEKMMEGMDKMMEGMGHQSVRPEIYPTLMGLSDMGPTNRQRLKVIAEERIHTGTVLLEEAHARLQDAIQVGDHKAATSAIQQIRAGTAELESGVAAHRLMLEGSPPQNAAMEWFRRTMSLPNPLAADKLSWFHYFTMFMLLAFVVLVATFQFQKSRRVASLLDKLTSEKDPGTAVNNPDAQLPSASVKEAQSGLPSRAQPVIAPSKSNSWTGQLLVARIFNETPQVKTYRLVSPDFGKLPFSYLPGQFLTFTVNPHGQNIKRSYTISSSPTHLDYCEVTVRHEPGGLVSGYLCEKVHEGELLQVTAPSGKFTFLGKDSDSIVLIAGGVGVTPMMSIVRYLTERSWFGDIYLIYGSKSEEEVVFREELEYLKRRYANLHVVLTASEVNPQTWPYATGRITKELIAASVPEISTRHIHLCGPKPMMEAVKTILAELGVPPQQVEVEVFVGTEPPKVPEDQGSASVDADSNTPALSCKVSFVRSGKVITLIQPKTLLEAAEDIGVNIDYSCRVGSCGVCKVKLLSGSVTMEVEDALDDHDKAQNMVLACQAIPTGDVAVDA